MKLLFWVTGYVQTAPFVTLCRCILYLKLFLLGGFTWIFEVLSFTFNDHAPSAWIWMIVDFFNCLHGILAFCVLILWRQRIRKELAGKQICCIICPAHWADVDDDEQVCLEGDEGNLAWPHISWCYQTVTNTQSCHQKQNLFLIDTIYQTSFCFCLLFGRQGKVRSYHKNFEMKFSLRYQMQSLTNTKKT